MRRSLIQALVGLVGGLFLTVFICKIAVMGHRIPSSHLVQDYLVGLVWAMAIAVYMTGLPISVIEKRDLVLLWGVRCTVTMGAMLFYEDFYPLDAIGYYRYAIQSSFDWTEAKYGAGTGNTAALSWVMNNFMPMFNSFHALKVVYSFIGFLASYVIYRAFSPFFERGSRGLMYLIFMFPSMIFWSSIVGKDPVILFGIALYVYGTVRLMYLGNVLYLIPLIGGITLAGMFRSWYLGILTLPLAALGIRGIKRPVFRVAFIGIIVAAALRTAQIFADQFRVASMGDLVSRTQSISHSWNYGGSGNSAPQFSGIASMLKFAPVGMFTALFRPLPGEVMNPFGLLAGFENLFLLLFVANVWWRGRGRKGRFGEPVTVWAIALILTWGFIYGFVSFQNLGAGVRFRLQILPVMLALLYYLNYSNNNGGASDVRHRGTD